jgi:DNA-directed RNA polymerase subunit RPC12/RpoP
MQTENDIIDGPHHFFECSKCKAPLADIWVNHIDKDLEWKFYAECPHCGDKSYQQTVYGSFFIGASEKSERYTKVVDYDVTVDPIVIKTNQVKPWRIR